MNILWVGGVAWHKDFEEMVRKGSMQAAANITQINIISGLDKIIGKPISILNGHLMPSYPKYKDIWIKKRKWSHINGAQDFDVGFINLPLIKLLIKGIALRYHARKWVKSLAQRSGAIIVYSPHSPFLWAAIAAKKLNPLIEICCIVPDLPEYMELSLSKKPIKWILKKIDRYLIDRLLKRVNFFVLFTKHMAKALHIEYHPWIVMEGIIDPNEFPEYEEPRKAEDNVIMYSGMLDVDFGIPELLSAFQHIINPNYQLWLTGDGNARQLILNLIMQDSRIKWFGYLPSRLEVLEKQKQARVLINVRRPTKKASKYCFPSKLIEYMASGTPVMTFQIEGIPEEYYNYCYVLKSENPRDMAKRMQEICSISDDILRQKGLASRNFVLRNCNYIVQARRIIDLFNRTK